MKYGFQFKFLMMLTALACASVLSWYLNKEQLRINPDQSKYSNAPLGGLHKSYSDVEWVRFINYLGKLEMVDENNVQEVTDRLERLIELDPKFERLYMEGVASLQFAAPAKTLEMLEKACELNHLKSNWKIPFYIGFMRGRRFYSIKNQNEVLLREDHEKAAQYFEMAIRRCPPEELPNYVINNYIRAKAKVDAAGSSAPDAEYAARLAFLYREWVRGIRSNPVNYSDDSRPPLHIPDIEPRLLSAIREAQNQSNVLEKRFELSPSTVELIERIRKDVFREKRLCPDCFSDVQRGDRFCGHCGLKFKYIEGLCSSCGALMPTGSRFCTACGQQAPPPQGEKSGAKKQLPVKPVMPGATPSASVPAPAAP